MRVAGELEPATGGKPSALRTVLSDLIGSRPRQRASEWASLAERKGAWRIEAMREAGELGKQGEGGPGRKSKSPQCGFLLSDLISSRPRQRASEWASLAMLTQASGNRNLASAVRTLSDLIDSRPRQRAAGELAGSGEYRRPQCGHLILSDLIEAMREAGELAEHGDNQWMSAVRTSLSDLISSRPLHHDSKFGVGEFDRRHWGFLNNC
jgi:hypothetical protein